ncbi:hypothetical protein [Branchiibius sp. NY16-3462-2]|uniref:VOC family protein n=1 Tax=Branchiibius sp. NY16-3462-2 TaxID=1807500 RepID=UPI00079A5ADE|nr:hypothetical protein [Branchiibius sp. NY16-3462-2]KYH44248.1 hypothetical protein AZH51_06785 [Branchiibius sp. NY16-3462-2]
MISVQAIRFSDNVPAMQQFLEAIGLSASVTSGDWAVMESGSGKVLLHGTANATSGAQSGWTQLTFETDELDVVAKEFGAVPVDESWGRSLFVTDPLGAEVVINEAQTDHYGYEQHAAHPDAAIAVVPVRFTDPHGPYAEFLVGLGLRPDGEGDYVALVADQGSVGLHVDRPDESARYLATGGGAQVHLTFTATGDVKALGEKLRAAGYDDLRIDTSFGAMIEVADPDGRLVQIHQA